MIIPHLFPAPASTVVKLAEHEFVRRPRLLLDAYQGFQQNVWSKTMMTGFMVKKILSSISVM